MCATTLRRCLTINLFTTQLKWLLRIFVSDLVSRKWKLFCMSTGVCYFVYVEKLCVFFLCKFPSIFVTLNKPNICKKRKKDILISKLRMNSDPRYFFVVDSKAYEMNCVSNLLFCHFVWKSINYGFISEIIWRLKLQNGIIIRLFIAFDSSKSNDAVNMSVDMSRWGLNELMVLNFKPARLW